MHICKKETFTFFKTFWCRGPILLGSSWGRRLGVAGDIIWVLSCLAWSVCNCRHMLLHFELVTIICCLWEASEWGNGCLCLLTGLILELALPAGSLRLSRVVPQAPNLESPHPSHNGHVRPTGFRAYVNTWCFSWPMKPKECLGRVVSSNSLLPKCSPYNFYFTAAVQYCSGWFSFKISSGRWAKSLSNFNFTLSHALISLPLTKKLR